MRHHSTHRGPAVAGSFYPADPARLRAAVNELLTTASCPPLHVRPRILIAPHAGHHYSGPIAATGYRCLPNSAFSKPIGLVGPSHFVPVPGMTIPAVDWFDTPLGPVAIDDELRKAVGGLPGVYTSDRGHGREHSLEVQLPFLQVLHPAVSMLPAVTGNAATEAAAVIGTLLDRGSVVIVSSDLSHYLDHRGARRKDAHTAQAIVDIEPDRLGPDDACGLVGIKGALLVARQRQWQCQLLDLRTSGDTAGSLHRVVGYGSFAFGPAE